MEVEQLEVALGIDIVVTSALWKALQSGRAQAPAPVSCLALGQFAALLSLSRAFSTGFGRSGDGGV